MKYYQAWHTKSGKYFPIMGGDKNKAMVLAEKLFGPGQVRIGNELFEEPDTSSKVTPEVEALLGPYLKMNKEELCKAIAENKDPIFSILLIDLLMLIIYKELEELTGYHSFYFSLTGHKKLVVDAFDSLTDGIDFEELLLWES